MLIDANRSKPKQAEPRAKAQPMQPAKHDPDSSGLVADWSAQTSGLVPDCCLWRPPDRTGAGLQEVSLTSVFEFLAPRTTVLALPDWHVVWKPGFRTIGVATGLSGLVAGRV